MSTDAFASVIGRSIRRHSAPPVLSGRAGSGRRTADVCRRRFIGLSVAAQSVPESADCATEDERHREQRQHRLQEEAG